jgi:hypothetical protein
MKALAKTLLVSMLQEQTLFLFSLSKDKFFSADKVNGVQVVQKS